MLRKAAIDDAKGIYDLLAFWAKKGKLLERSLNYIYEHIRDFWVYTDKGKVCGCCALHIIGWEDLAEVKSLAVAKNYQKRGIGVKLVRQCLEEAKQLGLKNIFALTFVDGFFKKQGFTEVDKKDLPHKIWSDCINCVSFPNCNEKAVIFRFAKQ
jgi:amino-acid N-acetyltransferase